MITLAKEKAVELTFEECTVTIKIHILTPAEFAQVQADKLSNEDIFRKYVLSGFSGDIEGWTSEKTATEILETPGTASIVAQGALAVINNSLLTPVQKN